MSYKKCYAERVGYNRYKIHLWEDSGYSIHKYSYPAYEECKECESEFRGLQGEYLKKTHKWEKSNPKLHFHDMAPYQRYLLDKYGTNDQTSQTHREVFFDIEIEMGDALTPEYIKKAPKKVTSIAWYDKQVDEWGIYILDEKNKISYTKTGNREVTPVSSEMELLAKWLEKFREIDPDILVGYNSDYFDIPYLYYRTCKILGEEYAQHFSPIGITKERINYQTGEIWNTDQPIEIAGVEPLDYMRLHKKYSWEDEPSWTLAYLGEKYAGLGSPNLYIVL